MTRCIPFLSRCFSSRCDSGSCSRICSRWCGEHADGGSARKSTFGVKREGWARPTGVKIFLKTIEAAGAVPERFETGEARTVLHMAGVQANVNKMPRRPRRARNGQALQNLRQQRPPYNALCAGAIVVGRCNGKVARLSWLQALNAIGPKMNDPTRNAIGVANSVVVNTRIQKGNGLSYSILTAPKSRSACFWHRLPLTP